MPKTKNEKESDEKRFMDDIYRYCSGERYKMSPSTTKNRNGAKGRIQARNDCTENEVLSNEQVYSPRHSLQCFRCHLKDTYDSFHRTGFRRYSMRLRMPFKKPKVNCCCMDYAPGFSADHHEVAKQISTANNLLLFLDCEILMLAFSTDSVREVMVAELQDITEINGII
eukprot:scaffold4855_cov99-Cylindrotheca_fusiformis.AAC.8